MAMLTLSEQHHIRRTDSQYAALDAASFAGKNLYNAANYVLRQAFFTTKIYIPFAALYHQMKTTPEYNTLPRKVSQLVLKQLDQNWQSFFAAQKAYQANHSAFLGRPKPPNYKDKVQGRMVLTYNNQASSRRSLRCGVIKLSGMDMEVPTKQTTVQQVRVVPYGEHYLVEVVYERELRPIDVDPTRVAGIDLGIDNLITLTTNLPCLTPVAVNGRVLKSINQYFNKVRARLQSFVGNRCSRRIRALMGKRARQITHHLHVISRRIIMFLAEHRVGTLIIGYNPGWKQSTNLGRKTNQSFVSLPHHQLIHMLAYKSQLIGIAVIEQEESYTSKYSFFDSEIIGKHLTYAGKRVKRGLFRTSTGDLVNADVNGSLNIVRKALPGAFLHTGEIRMHPSRVTFT